MAFQRRNYGDDLVVTSETRRALLVLAPRDPRIGQPIRPESPLLPASDAWVSPDGLVHPVHYAGHSAAAMRHLGDPTGGNQLEAAGWAHLSGGRVLIVGRISQRQIDAIWSIIDAYREAAACGLIDAYRVEWTCESLMDGLGAADW